MPRAGTITINSGQGSIGEVRKSMLTLVQFQAQNGTGWVLADGQNVSGSKYHTITGSTTVPDMRGVFLRGKNNGRADGNQDTGGERALGNFQGDQMVSHRHRMYSGSGGGGGTTLGNGSSQGVGGTTGASGLGYYDTAPSGGGNPYNENSGAGTETRSRNIAVNIFIKVN